MIIDLGSVKETTLGSGNFAELDHVRPGPFEA